MQVDVSQSGRVIVTLDEKEVKPKIQFLRKVKPYVTRNDFGFPVVTCQHCHGWIYSKDNLTVSRGHSYHGDCYIEFVAKV